MCLRIIAFALPLLPFRTRGLHAPCQSHLCPDSRQPFIPLTYYESEMLISISGYIEFIGNNEECLSAPDLPDLLQRNRRFINIDIPMYIPHKKQPLIR